MYKGKYYKNLGVSYHLFYFNPPLHSYFIFSCFDVTGLSQSQIQISINWCNHHSSSPTIITLYNSSGSGGGGLRLRENSKETDFRALGLLLLLLYLWEGETSEVDFRSIPVFCKTVCIGIRHRFDSDYSFYFKSRRFPSDFVESSLSFHTATTYTTQSF